MEGEESTMVPGGEARAGAGTATLEELLSARVPAGQVLAWWLGQASVLLRGGGRSLLLDPFLSPSPRRLHAAPFPASDLHGVDAVLITHEHGDHLDRETVTELARRASATWVAPAPIAGQLRELGVKDAHLVAAKPSTAIELGAVTIRPIEAHHGVQVADAYGNGTALSGGQVRFLGYLVQLGGVHVYHAGDTVVYEGLSEMLTRLGVHLAMLPINGRDFFRERQGIVGNMTAEEAAQLADRAGADVLVPLHYDMFAGNRGYPAHLVQVVLERFPKLAVWIPSRRRPFLYGAL